MENFTSQKVNISPKQLQSNIREAIMLIPVVGIEDSASRFNLQADTLKRVLGIRQTKSYNGRIKVVDWAINNNMSRFSAMNYLKKNNGNLSLESTDHGNAFFCDDIPYNEEHSDYYSVFQLSTYLGISRNNLDY